MKKKIRVLSLILALTISASLLFSCAGIGGVRIKLSGDEVYSRMNLSVVAIIMQDGSRKSGSGFFIDGNGTVLTSNHVVSGGGGAIIQLAGGKTYTVTEILSFDETKDLAILKTEAKNTTPAKLASAATRIGESVYALGYPQAYVIGTSCATFTAGMVSAMRERDGITYIQTTADVTAGNSGGPLINEWGEVVGVIASSVNIAGVDYMNLAVPIETVREFAGNYLSPGRS